MILAVIVVPCVFDTDMMISIFNATCSLLSLKVMDNICRETGIDSKFVRKQQYK